MGKSVLQQPHQTVLGTGVSETSCSSLKIPNPEQNFLITKLVYILRRYSANVFACNVDGVERYSFGEIGRIILWEYLEGSEPKVHTELNRLHGIVT